MRQVISSGSFNPLSNTVTEYNSIFWHKPPNWNSGEFRRQEMSGGTFKITGFYVELDGSPGIGSTYQFTIRLNGADTNLSVSITGSDTQKFIVDQNVNVTPTDKIGIECTPTSTPTIRSATWSITFESEGEGTSYIVNGQQNLLNGAVPSESNQLMGGSDWAATSIGSVNKNNIIPLSGVFRDLYIELDGVAGTGSNGWIFTIGTNGTDTGMTVNILGATTNGSDTSNTVTMSPGNFINLIATPRGTPNNRRVKWGIVFEADEADNFFIVGGGTESLSNTTTEYNYLQSADSAWNVTESENEALSQCMRLSNFYVNTGVPPGSNTSYTFTIRKNGADTPLSVQITGSPDFTGSNVTDFVEFDNFDKVTIKCTPTNSPAVTDAAWGVVGESMFPFPNSLSLVGHGR